MTNGQSQRGQELWFSVRNANDDAPSLSSLDKAGDWEDTVNRALGRMLENGTPVERAIAARLLLAESHLGRLSSAGPDDLMFAPEGE